MDPSAKTVNRTVKLTHYTWILAIVWTILIALFATWNVYEKKRTTKAMADKEARSHFNKDKATRFWATTHGGVYVITDERTPPNPHLKHISERDIITPSGKKLTLMNPSYMIRQMMEEYTDSYGIKGRITSLKPLRVQNAPDKWERSALMAFERGAEEILTFTNMNGAPYLRLMRPLRTKKSCLKCHGFQGYNVGDVRGGLGVAILMSPYLAFEQGEIKQLVISFSLIWLIGIMGLYLGFQRLKHHFTELLRSEYALHESEEKYRSMMEALEDAIYISSCDLRIEYMNPAMKKRTDRDTIGKPCHKIIYGIDEKCSWCIHEKVMMGESARNEIISPKDNKTYHLSSSPILHADGSVSKMTVSRDVTDLTEMENQLRQAQKMEAIGHLAGGVSHDFNNLLCVIIGSTELAMTQVDPSGQLYADLDEIIIAAGRATEITKQLLAFARKQPISPKVIELNENVEDMLKMLRRLIGEDIDLAWLPGETLWPVKIDTSQLDQILTNLCVNARDAIKGVGKVTVETKTITFDRQYCLDHTGFVPGDFVLLAVSDNGHGIDKETLNNIFEPFFTTKDAGKGTGLGLATVYGIVKHNKGFINVYSELGNGTTIKIYFPRHEGKTHKILRERKIDIPPGRGETILLVDDELQILKLTGKILTGLGYSVLTASTPSEAMGLTEKQFGEIKLLLTDVIMPEMTGRELAERLLSRYPDIKSIYMSGYMPNAIAHHSVLDEGVHFIQKPFSKTDLAGIVRTVLDEEKTGNKVGC